MNKNLIVSGIAVLLICVGLSGCNEQATTAHEDEDFMDWFYSSAEETQYDCQMIGKYSGEYNLYLLETWCEELEDDTDRYLNDIYDYSISSKYQSLRNEYQEALKDYNLAGYYGRIGAKYENGAGIRKSAEYLDKGTDHINRCTDIIYGLN